MSRGAQGGAGKGRASGDSVQRDSSSFHSPDRPEGRPFSEVSIIGTKLQPPVSPLAVNDDNYYMMHEKRGKAIIFNHETFGDNLNQDKREGTKIDCELLEQVLQKLGFFVRIYDDPTKKEIIETLVREQHNEYHARSDCMVMVVLTHGKDEGLLYAKDDFYHVTELWAPFMAVNCPQLASKPKIFIIQACRGDSASRAVEVNKLRTRTDSIKMRDDRAGENFSIPNEADILVAYSTFEGRVAYRDTIEGTWFINELCKELEENAENDDLLTMLTRVNRRVALEREIAHEKQMPSIQSTLTRKIYFKGPPLKQTLLEFPLQDITAKLEKIELCIEKCMHFEMHGSMPVLAQAPSMGDPASTAWEMLRERVTALPIMEQRLVHGTALRHAKALKMFLQWRNIDDDVQKHGEAILTLLSLWNVLQINVQKFTYGQAVWFLIHHGKNWPFLEVMDVPNVGFSELNSRCTTPDSRIRKQSQASNQSGGSARTADLKPRPIWK